MDAAEVALTAESDQFATMLRTKAEAFAAYEKTLVAGGIEISFAREMTRELHSLVWGSIFPKTPAPERDDEGET